MDACEGCRGLRGHARIKDAMCKEFEQLHAAACIEHARVLELYKRGCWYNFEVGCRTWRNPWHESLGACGISLGSWYAGSIAGAPALPVEILEREVAAAAAEVRRCKEQCSAPHDWAPGGRRYEQLCRASPGAAAYGILYTHNARQSSNECH
jgi:hypothetical protein